VSHRAIVSIVDDLRAAMQRERAARLKLRQADEAVETAKNEHAIISVDVRRFRAELDAAVEASIQS